jgi:hypothetical protein
MFLFSKPSRPTLGPTQRPIQWVPAFFPEGKAAGAWNWPLISILCGGYEWVDVYLSSLYAFRAWTGTGTTYVWFAFPVVPYDAAVNVTCRHWQPVRRQHLCCSKTSQLSDVLRSSEQWRWAPPYLTVVTSKQHDARETSLQNNRLKPRFDDWCIWQG